MYLRLKHCIDIMNALTVAVNIPMATIFFFLHRNFSGCFHLFRLGKTLFFLLENWNPTKFIRYFVELVKRWKVFIPRIEKNEKKINYFRRINFNINKTDRIENIWWSKLGVQLINRFKMHFNSNRMFVWRIIFSSNVRLFFLWSIQLRVLF